MRGAAANSKPVNLQHAKASKLHEKKSSRLSKLQRDHDEIQMEREHLLIGSPIPRVHSDIGALDEGDTGVIIEPMGNTALHLTSSVEGSFPVIKVDCVTGEDVATTGLSSTPEKKDAIKATECCVDQSIIAGDVYLKTMGTNPDVDKQQEIAERPRMLCPSPRLGRLVYQQQNSGGNYVRYDNNCNQNSYMTSRGRSQLLQRAKSESQVNKSPEAEKQVSSAYSEEMADIQFLACDYDRLALSPSHKANKRQKDMKSQVLSISGSGIDKQSDKNRLMVSPRKQDRVSVMCSPITNRKLLDPAKSLERTTGNQSGQGYTKFPKIKK